MVAAEVALSQALVSAKKLWQVAIFLLEFHSAMKTVWRSILAALFVVPGINADVTDKEKEVEARLRRVPALEFPAAVLGIVRATEATKRVETIQAAMNVIAAHRPATLPLVVATIAKAEPQLSAAAASAALAASPAQAGLIGRAAVTAAPTQAENITAAIEAQDHKERHAVERGGPGQGEENGNGPRPKQVEPDKSWRHPRETGTLPNGKPFPDPPRRPVDPPRPVHYGKPPKPDHPGRPEHPRPERPGNPNPGGKPVRPTPPGGHPVWDR